MISVLGARSHSLSCLYLQEAVDDCLLLPKRPIIPTFLRESSRDLRKKIVPDIFSQFQSEGPPGSFSISLLSAVLLQPSWQNRLPVVMGRSCERLHHISFLLWRKLGSPPTHNITATEGHNADTSLQMGNTTGTVSFFHNFYSSQERSGG